MLWQMIAVVSLIILSTAYLGWKSFKNWTSRDDCQGCGCGARKKKTDGTHLIDELEITRKWKQGSR